MIEGSFHQATTENNMLQMLTSQSKSAGDGSSSVNRNKATYIDLDLLTTLETRITSIQELNDCPVYYLGWTQQTSKPWHTDKKPNSFELD